VQTARDLVALATELATGVQHGENYFGCAFALVGTRWVGVNRNTTAIVFYSAAAIGQQSDGNAVAKAGHRLVDRVVNDLPNEVVKASEASGPDIHTGTFTNGV
jgi:hypothetical protein